MSKRILILLLITSLVILTFCTKKSTAPEEQLFPPTNLTISLVENNKIQINWIDNSTNELKVIIDRKKGIEYWFENYNEVSENITIFNDIIPTNSDTIYSYRFKAFDGEKYSAYSDTIAWFSNNSAPSGLQVEQITQDTLKLTWQDNSIGEQYFRIDRKIDEKGWQMDYAHVPADTTHFVDYTTALYDTCNYKVFAVTGISHSDSTENAFIPFLPAPSNLELQALGATEVTLTWLDNCQNEDGYRLFYKRGETAFWDSLNLPINTQEYSDENVVPGIMNYYKICSYYENDTSCFDEDSINTLPSPSDLQFEQLSDNEIELTWQDNSNFEDGFVVERKIDGENYDIIAIVGQDIKSYIDDSFELHIIYYYRVCGFFQGYQSDYSNSANGNGYYHEIWVPEDYPQIQTAINNASTINNILVHPGIYIENINYNGKNIDITSSDGPEITIIDGNQNGSVVIFNSGEESTARLSGFKIINGLAQNNYGGGIYCHETSPTLENLIITNNYAPYGGGICCKNNSSPIIRNATINANSSSMGGGIYCYYVSEITIKNVNIIENSASRDGGGIYCYQSSLTLQNSIIASNESSDGGGACFRNWSPSILVNVIIMGNNATSDGGGCLMCASSPLNLINSIVSNNTGNYGLFLYPGNSSITYSNFYNNENGNLSSGNLGTGCNEGNPLFVDPSSGDYHLKTGSPCIDTGNPNQIYNDPDGSRNDMGAYGGPNGNW